MRLENTFVVDSPPERAWPLFLDVPVVVSCMPGAELVATIDDSHWTTSLSVKLGPVNLVFDADLEREVADPAARRVVITSKARERKGRGGATARVESTVEPEGDGSRIVIVTDVNLSGTAAQFGRPVVEDVSRQLTARFAACLQTKLGSADDLAPAGEGLRGPAERAQAVSGLSMLLHAIVRSATRVFRRAR